MIALAIAMLVAESLGGRLFVRCADGSPCPLKTVEPKPCCRHKPCDKPLPPTCVVVKTPSVETIKPPPSGAPATPFVALLPAAPALADLLTPPPARFDVADFEDPSPPARPALAVHGPRPPPAPMVHRA
jgi:hypothetical protein